MFWNKKLHEEIDILRTQLVEAQSENRKLRHKLHALECSSKPVTPTRRMQTVDMPSYHTHNNVADTFVEDVVQAAATYYIMDTIMDSGNDSSSSDSYDSGSSYDSSDCGSYGSDD